MTAVKMIPHSLVRLIASVVLAQLANASKTVPDVSMTIANANRMRSTYEDMAMDSSEMLDDLF